MKKSEMISKLQDLLENVNIYNPRVAREVLQLVEDEGMLPPNKNETIFIKLNSNSIDLEEFTRLMKLYKWENE